MPHTPRDLVGYGQHPPKNQWPHGAKVAVSFVLNYEEGAENHIDNGDAGSEAFLTEMYGATSVKGGRDPIIESDYEYGSRVAVWRIMNLFEEHKMPITFYAVGMALEKNLEVAKYMPKVGEVASHAYRWVHYQNMPYDEEKKLVEKQLDCFRQIYGKPPVGWYYGRCSENSREIVAKTYKEQGIQLLYESDDYSDDLPHWIESPATPGEGLLIVPYEFDNNDFKFQAPNGYGSPSAYFEHLKNGFDTLYEEAEKTGVCKMMSLGLHCRIIGKPSRFPALKKFVEYIEGKDAWVTTRTEIANHWIANHPYKK